MKLSGVHFLLTYRCTQECDHCFVFGSPKADATFTSDRLTAVLEQCAAVGSVDWVFFEGGEPTHHRCSIPGQSIVPIRFVQQAYGLSRLAALCCFECSDHLGSDG